MSLVAALFLVTKKRSTKLKIGIKSLKYHKNALSNLLLLLCKH